MVSIALLALVIAVVYGLSRSGHAAPDAASPLVSPTDERLADWVAAGLLSDEQAAAILAHEAAHAPPLPPARSRGRQGWERSAVVEPLGYLGGVLAVVGLALVVARFWEDMDTASRLALSGATAAACVVAGSLVREDAQAALARLRWSLWLAATAAAGLFGGIAVAEGLGADAPESVVLAVSGTVTALSTSLWRGRDRPVQQATSLAGAITAAGAAVAHADPVIGAGATVVLVGAAVLVAGIRRLLTAPALTTAIGAVAIAIGSQILAVDRPALQLVAVGSGFSLVSLASIRRLEPKLEHRIAGTVGALVLLLAVPGTLGYFAQDAGIVTGGATWLVGAGVLAAGDRRLVERARVVEVVGGIAMLGGAALTGVASSAVAPVFGIATAIALLVLGARSEQLRHSVLGALGLLANVPWAIGRFFPGEGRVPLLILATGVLVVGFAVVLARHDGRRPGPPLIGLGPKPS